jgi:hypothetical protein
MLTASNLSTAGSACRKRSTVLGASCANGSIEPNRTMKSLKYITLIAALASGLALTAKADLIVSPFGDIPKNGTGPGFGNGNNAADNFFRLQQYIIAHPAFSIGDPIFAGAERFENLNGTPPELDLTGFCYAVIHYGSGGGTTGSGGGVAFFTINNDSDTPPANGPGPNGLGGISSVDLFACTPTGVPDSGTAAMLLGGALAGLGLMRRYLKR